METRRPADRSGRMLTPVVALLCLTSGSVDAVSVLALGGAFSSVMTGNLVLVGASVGTWDGALAVSCAAAIPGYVVGGLVGSMLVSRGRHPSEAAIWPRRVTRTLCAEGAVLLLVAAGWVLGESGTVSKLDLVLLGLTAMAMGMQSSAVRAVGVSISTTYMTGALIRLVEALVVHRRIAATEIRAAWGLGSVVVGALVGALVLTQQHSAALLVPFCALAAAVLASTLRERSLREPVGDSPAARDS